MNSENVRYPTYNYRDIFLKYFFLNKDCRLACPEYTLIFVFSGKLIIHNENYNITVQKGEYIFLRKDIETILIRESVNNEAFRSIYMGLNHSFLREFYRNMNQENIPHDARNFRKNIIKLPQNPYLESLYISMQSYMQWRAKPIKQILKIRLTEAVFSLLSTNKSFYPCLFDFLTPHKSCYPVIPDKNYYTNSGCLNFSNYQQCIISKELETTYIEMRQGAEITDIYMEIEYRSITHFIREYAKYYDPLQLN